MEKKEATQEVESVENNTANATVETKQQPADKGQNQAKANSTNNRQLVELVPGTKLIENGAHIGLNTKLWNPKMKPYIHQKGNHNYIIDIVKTLGLLNNAYTYLKEITSQGYKVLIVGTRGKAFRALIKDEATRAQSYYVTQRWLGGTLTNFKNISKSIAKLNNFIQLEKSGELEKYNKKERLEITRETEKLNKFYGGIRTMRSLPKAIIVLDPVNDYNAVLEAKKLGITVIAFANINADPTNIDHIIPINNYSLRSIFLALGVLCDAITSAKDEPTKIIGVKPEDIELPEVPEKKKTYNNNYNKKPYQKRPYDGKGKFEKKDSVKTEKPAKTETSKTTA